MTTVINGTSTSASAPAVVGDDSNSGVYFPSSDQVAIATNGTQALIVNASQRVGIKNATPQGTFDVGGLNDGSSAGDFLVDSTNGAAVVTVGRISGTSSDNTNFRVRNRVDQQAFFVNAGNRTAQVGSTFGVGDATPANTGAGVTFPASQNASSNANTLDDYEEGTWTPVVTSGGGSLTSYTSSGTYTKVGNLVTVMGYITLTNVGTASGTLNYSGLPFTANYPTGFIQPATPVRESNSTGNIYYAIVNGGNTTGYIQDSTAGAIAWTNNYRYSFVVTYQT